MIQDDYGNKYWYKEGKLHREDGPAIEFVSGEKRWYKEGKCHREGGPAIEYINGGKYWYKEGKLHREDGPAVEHVDGRIEYWKNSKSFTKEDFIEIGLHYINCKKCNKTFLEKILCL